MSIDLQLKPSCSGCGSSTDLYGSNCKHMTLCLTCGKSMAENKAKCYDCGATVSRLIREYSVRPSSSNDKNYFIARFMTGLPDFSRKKSAENKWSLHKDLQGRQLTDALREKYKNKPWLLEDETGQSQYQGHLEGAQSATYYLLMKERKEFVAIPAGSWYVVFSSFFSEVFFPWNYHLKNIGRCVIWHVCPFRYNFNKVAQYKQLTLEEAEEKMKNRKKTADGYERWMMKAANNGPAAFGEHGRFDDKESNVGGGGRGRRKPGDDDEGHVSDKGEEDEEEEEERKNRLGLNKKRDGDDDEEGPRGGDHDLDDDDSEKGDDWEHEEIFTDDDEAVGNDPEEREDLAPEVPAPPEIKQDEDDEDEDNEEEGGLSKSGKELKKLLGRASGMNESDAEDDDDDDEMDDEVGIPPLTAPKQKDAPKEEPVDNSPLKPAPSGPARGTPPSSKSSKGKRKANEDTKANNSTPPKKVKTENELKPSVKDETAPISKSNAPPKGTQMPSSSSKAVSSTPASGPVSEEEIRAVLKQKTPVTTQDLVAKFKARLRSPEDKKAFADILKRISKIQKTNNTNYIILRDK
ncbi:Transcription initiation factor IIF subunit alpha [Senna tora]|uniref:Transcription initiation factor IIF subunit alpha n=1 Tax=Senna tora TaxID=362788 RepID=A0A834W2X3_9FABA|nr:Transcription initiation factor IIF subunit alpha [Senna tora]